jgi:hypothetical protein
MVFRSLKEFGFTNVNINLRQNFVYDTLLNKFSFETSEEIFFNIVL